MTVVFWCLALVCVVVLLLLMVELSREKWCDEDEGDEDDV